MMSSDFDNTLREVRVCRLCETHLPDGVRPILQMSPTARILIAGQAPGRRVNESGIPFNDPSGDRLRSWMAIDRATFYNASQIAILPMGFCYPGTGKNGDLPPRPECAEAWRLQLLAMMPNIELTLLIGQYAQAWHLKDRQKENLTHTVKAWQDYWPSQLPLPHPSPRNNLWLKHNPWFEESILRVLRPRIQQLLNASI